MSLSFNDRRVMETVFRGSALSRIEMSETIGLTPPSVTRIVNRLLDEGAIEERADHTGQQGQPRRIISIVRGRHFGAGVNFSRRRLQVALVDLAGLVVGTEQVALDRATPEAITEATETGLATLLGHHGLQKTDLAGFGVSVPSNFGRSPEDFKAHALFPEVEGPGFGPSIERMFDAPCFFENDGSCATLGEHMFGAGRGFDNLFLIHLGHGVGGGGIIDGRLYRGANGNACLPGPIFPINAPRPSGQDLLDELAARGLGELEFTDLDAPATALLHHVEAWMDRAADQLGLAVRIIDGLFDPSTLILGGRLPSWMNSELVRRIGTQTLQGPSRGLTLSPLLASHLGPLAGSVGAACLPLFSRYFTGAIADSFSNYHNGRKSKRL